MLKEEIIRPNKRPWNTPKLVVPKRNDASRQRNSNADALNKDSSTEEAQINNIE
jgi:hypothetical protein